MEENKKELGVPRQPLKTLNQNKLHKNAHHVSWKEKLRESCYRRVREDRTRLLWRLRLPLQQSCTQKEFIKSAFQDIVSDELKKIKDQSSRDSKVPSSISEEDDILWEYDGLHNTQQGECEEILLEMQRIFYEDSRMELSGKEGERVLEDEEDEYLASAVNEYMQLNDGKAWKEQIWCPVCKKGELQEKRQHIYCSICHLELNRGDEVNLDLLKNRLAEAHEEHLDRGCRSKPEFCIETIFDITALYIKCQQCNMFEVYAQAGTYLWSFLLSAQNKNAWIGIGFSTNGFMIGSSAMVGWVYQNGTGMALQYHLAFQLTTNQPRTKLLYAVGPTGVLPQASNGYTLTQHQDEISTTLNYATGQSQAQNSPYTGLRRTHGALNMIGWGILIPIGAMIARYFRQWDPIWFYSHTAVQIFGFLFGLVAFILGFVLQGFINAKIGHHKNLGIVILILGSLQVMALLVRPQKGSKARKYWNFYHHNAGRLLVILAISNIFYGIRLGMEGRSWYGTYAIIVAIFFVLAIILEIRLRRQR